jgi:hypothetical protein
VGIFYDIFGVLQLGVTIDLVLLLGALLTVLGTFLPKATVQTQALAHG